MYRMNTQNSMVNCVHLILLSGQDPFDGLSVACWYYTYRIPTPYLIMLQPIEFWWPVFRFRHPISFCWTMLNSDSLFIDSDTLFNAPRIDSWYPAIDFNTLFNLIATYWILIPCYRIPTPYLIILQTIESWYPANRFLTPFLIPYWILVTCLQILIPYLILLLHIEFWYPVYRFWHPI